MNMMFSAQIMMYLKAQNIKTSMLEMKRSADLKKTIKTRNVYVGLLWRFYYGTGASLATLLCCSIKFRSNNEKQKT